MEVVKKKQKKYGTRSVNFSLLVFVNHEKSKEWINLLRKNVNSECPFLSIWTIHLRFKKGGKEVEQAVAQRIAPLPGLRVEANTNDPEVHKPQTLPTYIEQRKEDEHTYITFKTEFIDKIRKVKLRKQESKIQQTKP